MRPAPSRTHGASKAWAGRASPPASWSSGTPPSQRPTTSSIRSRAARTRPATLPRPCSSSPAPSKARRSARPAVPWSFLAHRSPTSTSTPTSEGTSATACVKPVGTACSSPVPATRWFASKSTTSKRGSSPAPNSRARPRGPANRPSMALGNASPSVPAVKPASALLHRSPPAGVLQGAAVRERNSASSG